MEQGSIAARENVAKQGQAPADMKPRTSESLTKDILTIRFEPRTGGAPQPTQPDRSKIAAGDTDARPPLTRLFLLPSDLLRGCIRCNL